MKRILSGCLIVIVASLCYSSFVQAETLKLYNGQKVSGSVLDKSELLVQINEHGLPMTYYLGEIEAINGKKVFTLEANTERI